MRSILSRLLSRFSAKLQTKMKFKNTFHIEHYDKDGNLKGKYELPNGIVDVGIEHLLDVGFHADTPTATWYIGLVDNSGFSAFATGDTMASHAGWNEFTTYSEGTREAWVEDAAAARAISNTTSADFSITGSGTMKGVFITSDNVKSAGDGILWATAAFAANVPVVNGDSLKITYTISG